MALNTRRAALVALLYTAVVKAHDHDMDAIPDGEAISPDPIVR
jgi:hypothetical protein